MGGWEWTSGVSRGRRVHRSTEKHKTYRQREQLNLLDDNILHACTILVFGPIRAIVEIPRLRPG